MDLALVLGAVAVVAAIMLLWWAVSGTRPDATVSLDPSPTPRSLPGHVDQRTLSLSPAATERAMPMLERFGRRLRSLLPTERTNALAAKLHRAGNPAQWTVERVLAGKVLLAMAVGAFASLRFVAEPDALNLLVLVGGVVIGWFAPNALLDGKVARRQEEVRAALADMIDQLGVMVRAGLSIDAAVVRIIQLGDGPLTDELRRVVREMRIGVGRSVALTNMAERVDLPELRGFVSALSQADQLGVPVSDTLRVQADELRTRQRQYAEGQAMKLPVKILFPMVLCILPVLFIVVLGPAAMRILDQFSP